MLQALAETHLKSQLIQNEGAAGGIGCANSTGQTAQRSVPVLWQSIHLFAFLDGWHQVFFRHFHVGQDL